MVKVAQILEVPVVITEQVPKVFQATVPEIMEKFNALPQNLRCGPHPKTKFGMLIPEVGSFLSENDIETVVLFGVESHICVLQTTMALLGLGKDVYVLADGVSSINRQEVPIALARMQSAGAQITTSESFLYELMGDASDPRFRSFAALMKEEKESISNSLRLLL